MNVDNGGGVVPSGPKSWHCARDAVFSTAATNSGQPRFLPGFARSAVCALASRPKTSGRPRSADVFASASNTGIVASPFVSPWNDATRTFGGAPGVFVAAVTAKTSPSASIFFDLSSSWASTAAVTSSTVDASNASFASIKSDAWSRLKAPGAAGASTACVDENLDACRAPWKRLPHSWRKTTSDVA